MCVFLDLLRELSFDVFFFFFNFFFINILPIKFYISQLYHMLGKFRPDID